MLGITCRLHDLTGDDCGIAHLPHPVAVGDLAATDDREFRVVDVVLVPPGSVVGALVKVQNAHLNVAAT